MTTEDWTRLANDPRVTISATGSWLEGDAPKVDES